MQRVVVLTTIGGAAIIVFALLTVTLLERIPDVTAKATVAAAFIAVVGVGFTAIFSEISARYKEAAAARQRKWELVFPLLKDHYYPWYSSTLSLTRAIQWALQGPIEEHVDRILYLVMIFYGRRLRFLVDAGGLLLLSSREDEDKVTSAYRRVEDALRFAGNDTPKHVSFLQGLFMEMDRKDKPFTLSKFVEELERKRAGARRLTVWTVRQRFRQWASADNLEMASNSLDEFATTLKSSIDNLYTI